MAAVMFAEVAAYAQSQGKSVACLLDDIYGEFGFHLEQGKSMVMEGAQGAAQIQELASSYSKNPPKELDGAKVVSVRDFSQQVFLDEEGDEVDQAGMLIVDLEGGRSFAIRPSGTEPKIKFYLFGKEAPQQDLAASKERVQKGLEALWTALEADAQCRMGEQ